MKFKFIIIILVFGFVENIAAYPITPRPLRKLVAESQYIVYADVIKIETIKAEGNWNDAKAILNIKEVLQGKIKTNTIEVFFSPGIICPSPANYENGTTVLAFLDKQKKVILLTHYLTVLKLSKNLILIFIKKESSKHKTFLKLKTKNQH